MSTDRVPVSMLKEMQDKVAEMTARLKFLEERNLELQDLCEKHLRNKWLAEDALRKACGILANAEIQAYAFKTQSDIQEFLTSAEIKSFLSSPAQAQQVKEAVADPYRLCVRCGCLNASHPVLPVCNEFVAQAEPEVRG